MILSTFSHIYIEWDLLIAQVANVIIFFIKMTYVIFLGGGGFYFWDCFCLSKTDNSLVLYFIEENWWFYTWVLFLLEINGFLLVRLSWIKINTSDIIICDEWIRTWMLENKCLGLSSIDMNIEDSYQLWSINKWGWLNIVIQ